MQRLLANANSIEPNAIRCQLKHNLSQPTPFTPRGITELLSRNQTSLQSSGKLSLPHYVKSIECNQLASNSPIEDRLRVSTIQLPNSEEPTLLLGVFDGHGGGTTADLISRRLFSYIALALHPDPQKLKISNHLEMRNIVTDLHTSPLQDENNFGILHDVELNSLMHYKQELDNIKPPMECNDIIANLKSSFNRCDNDLAREIQNNLTGPNRRENDLLHYYLSAAVSGCCAIVMVIHKGIGYIASSGDCRAVMGVATHYEQTAPEMPTTLRATSILDSNSTTAIDYRAFELNDEHNCDNVNEIRRLAAAHPRSEENTMIKQNRLLGHLMPFRAFGDFTYKWPADLIKACGITRAFGSHIIPSHYETPPYLIVEPDVNTIQISKDDNKGDKQHKQKQLQNNRFPHCDEYNELMKENESLQNSDNMQKYLVIATDGLWELFESSREVIETIVDHSRNSMVVPITDDEEDEYDKNCATHILRSALQFRNSSQDVGADAAELKRRYHYRLEYSLSLPPAVVRNFRDDISIILLKL